jgi:hypothetical protein
MKKITKNSETKKDISNLESSQKLSQKTNNLPKNNLKTEKQNSDLKPILKSSLKTKVKNDLKTKTVKIQKNLQEKSQNRKKILILSWEIFPLYAGGLGFLTQSVVEEMVKQNCEVVVLVPNLPKNMKIENTQSLDKRVRFYLKKNKEIPNLDFELDNFGQKKVNQVNWPALYSNQKIKNNKKFNIYPQNTPAISKAFAWSVLEFIQENNDFDLIIGMDWETIPSFYLLENYFGRGENLTFNQEDGSESKNNLVKSAGNSLTNSTTNSNAGSSILAKNNEIQAENSQNKENTTSENLTEKIQNELQIAAQKTSLKKEKKFETDPENSLENPKKPEFYFYINATELDRGPEQINQKESKENPLLTLEKKAYKLASKVISISDITRNILTDHYQVLPEKILTVYNDIHFEPSTEHFDNITGGKNVLFIGRLEVQKGLFFLLETALRVLEIDPQVKFFIAGDGDLLPQLVENICEKVLEKSFFLTGWVNEADKKRLYKSCDLFVMPSPSEPFGLTPLEAIRSGTAVISSKTCGFLSLIPSTPTFAYHDINNFAQLIIYYLHNPNERNRLLETQKKELAQHSWSKEIAKILDTLE